MTTMEKALKIIAASKTPVRPAQLGARLWRGKHASWLPAGNVIAILATRKLVKKTTDGAVVTALGRKKVA